MATGHRLAMADEAITQVEEVVPGVREEAKKWLPAASGAGPEKDVSGSDPGPVTRFPGLVRSQFLRDETKIEASYAGRADFDAVLTTIYKVLSQTDLPRKYCRQTRRESATSSSAVHPGRLNCGSRVVLPAWSRWS